MPKDAKGRLKPGYEQHVFVCGHERGQDATRESCQHKNSLQLMKKLKHMAKDEGLKSIRVQNQDAWTFVKMDQVAWFILKANGLPLQKRNSRLS